LPLVIVKLSPPARAPKFMSRPQSYIGQINESKVGDDDRDEPGHGHDRSDRVGVRKEGRSGMGVQLEYRNQVASIEARQDVTGSFGADFTVRCGDQRTWNDDRGDVGVVVGESSCPDHESFISTATRLTKNKFRVVDDERRYEHAVEPELNIPPPKSSQHSGGLAGHSDRGQ
jgi:hypothetical protein